MPITRKFGGKTYTLQAANKTRGDANALAKRRRGMGQKARVTKSTATNFRGRKITVYGVWVR